MTTAPILTTEEKAIKIAEVCGWADICKGEELEANFKYFDRFKGHAAGLIPARDGMQWYEEIPDYFTSLDAMHEAEKIIVDDQGMWCEYWDVLSDVTGAAKQNGWGKHYTDERLLLHASAAQRAEAFGKALALW